MNHALNQRRRFLWSSLIAVGAVASPWGLPPARAALYGRAVIGFQTPPDQHRFLKLLLEELRSRYQPDLGLEPVVVPGAAGGMAIATVAQADPDGGTVLIAPSTMLSLLPLVMKTPSDPAETLIPVAGIHEVVLAFIVGPAVPVQVLTMADYLEWVRANPQFASYGVPALWTLTHYVGAEVSRLADLPLHAVGYKGGAALVEDIATGKIAAGVCPLPDHEELGRSPQMRVLAVTGQRRISLLPDVPTLLACGLSEDVPTESLGMYLPKGTPDRKVEELAAAVRAAAGSRVLMDAMRSMGMPPMPVSTESYRDRLAAERAMWRTLVARHDFTVGG